METYSRRPFCTIYRKRYITHMLMYDLSITLKRMTKNAIKALEEFGIYSNPYSGLYCGFIYVVV